MQRESTFTVKKSAVLRSLGLCLFVLVFCTCAGIVVPILGVLRLVHLWDCYSVEAPELRSLVLAGCVGLILFILFSLILICLTAISLRIDLAMLGISISVFDEGILIAKNGAECLISRAETMHILKYRTTVDIIWDFKGASMTFSISRNLFGPASFGEICRLLSRFEEFTDDCAKAWKVTKKLRLNRIFRRNRYEYHIGNLAKQ